jgi:hypothetical protein
VKRSVPLLAGAISSVIVALSTFGFAQQLVRQPATPTDPVTGILEAFRSHDIVAVTAGHGQARGYAFLLSLIRDPRVVAVINDIVIEEGNARYQDVADRFTSGADVSLEILSTIWQNTTQPTLAVDGPWVEIFTAVRTLNSTLPRERTIRILLGDPPIDWDNIRTAADQRSWIELRESYPADVIQREVLAKHRRALLTYGQGHFQRKNMAANYESSGQAETIVSRLESLTGAKIFTIWTAFQIPAVQQDTSSWPLPSLAVVRGTVLGSADFSAYVSTGFIGTTTRFPIRDGKVDFSAPIPRDQWRTLQAEDQFDAVLYPGAGPFPDVPIASARCRDQAYLQERARRMALAGLPPAVFERLQRSCATAQQ